MAKGCNLCFAGTKAVIFITGLCDDNCYYCPVNRNKLGHDVFYVNETPVTSIEEALLEIMRSGATSASITGGDPLTRFDRTIEMIRSLKETFGKDFHIHLYTSGRYATREVLQSLDRSGLDEIRFHPTIDSLVKRVGVAKRYTSMDVGLEIPIAPDLIDWAKRIILEADRQRVDFINLNEMEFVEPNARLLLQRGLRESKRRPFTVEGAFEVAMEIIKWAEDNVKAPVHFCPATFKDAIQTRNRLINTARVDRRWNETVTRSGTVIFLRKIKDEEGLCEQVEAYPTLTRKPIVSITKVECD